MPEHSSETRTSGWRPREIVDTHFHLWNLDENYYPWLSDGDRPTLVKNFHLLRKNYLISDYLNDVGDLPVVAGVHVQAEHDHSDPVRETRWLQRLADDPQSRGIPQGIVTYCDLAAPNAEEILAAHCEYANVRGVRQALHRRLGDAPPYDPLEDPRWASNIPLLKKYGLSFDTQLFIHQIAPMIDVIDSNPDISFNLTHSAMLLPLDADGMSEWRRGIKSLAERPNVMIKVSGFGGVDEMWRHEIIDPVIDEIISAFTPSRCMLASNFPVESLTRSYRDVWSFYFEYFASYSDDEKQSVFAATAARVYRLAI